MSIKLFISDIDGCLARPYRPYDLNGLAELAKLVIEGENGTGPRLALCSGRPYSYVESMSQVLGVQHPVLFESGGGCFHPETTGTIWNPEFTDEVEEAMKVIRRWLGDEIIPRGTFKLDYDKRTQAGLLSPHAEDILAVLPDVKAYVREVDDSLNVFHTDVSIDVVASNITKRESLMWLGEMCDISVENMAYIGDTNGDLGALDLVGVSYAPANATSEVCDKVDYVMVDEVVHGTISAFLHARELVAESVDNH